MNFILKIIVVYINLITSYYLFFSLANFMPTNNIQHRIVNSLFLILLFMLLQCFCIFLKNDNLILFTVKEIVNFITLISVLYLLVFNTELFFSFMHIGAISIISFGYNLLKKYKILG